MIVIDDGVSRLELSVLGYEFPKAVTPDDANWLTIAVNVSEKGGASWEAKDNCLRTFELAKLRDWFEAIQQGKEVTRCLAFTENELAFRYESVDRRLYVALDFAFHPKGKGYDYGVDEAYVISFGIEEDMLSSILCALDKEVESFPVRGS